MRALPIVTAGLLAGAACLTFTSRGQAEVTIKHPKAPADTDYRVELEPHLNMSIFHRDYYGGRYYGGYYGYDPVGDPEFGAGFRATIKIVDPVIPQINNSIGITFGLDITNCHACYKGFFWFGPEVGAQWNFYITDKFSTFADLGIMLRADGFYAYNYFDFFAMAGGRWHFTRNMSLTFRFGYPFITAGVSFFI
jgi:hypothetical protein